jgi:CRP/FNR family cyclic AMP-dependent transcriptional regulator
MARLDPQAADELLKLAAGRIYQPGEVLMWQGAVGTHVYLLEPAPRGTSACVKVTATSENGIETLFGIRAAGDIVGEIAVLERGRRTATVTACSQLIGHPIPADIFMSFLARRPQAWHAVSLMIADRLRWANHRRLDLAGYDVWIQIARVIIDILEHYGQRSSNTGELGVGLSQPELGSLVGASKEAAAKAVRRLRELGFIETGYRTIIVLDVTGLRAAAGLPEDPKTSLSSLVMALLQILPVPPKSARRFCDLRALLARARECR